MSSDNARQPVDVPWRQIGTGISQRFRCALCDKPSESAGRKLRRVQGVRQYVCKGCAK